MERHHWQKSLITAIDKTENATVHLLTCDWLRYDQSPPHPLLDEKRSAELRRIRQIFVPDLTLALHNLLMSHHRTHPPFLQRALNLSMVVAAQENHVYEEFFGRNGGPYRLIGYLDKIREASLAALEGGSGSAFNIASVHR